MKLMQQLLGVVVIASCGLLAGAATYAVLGSKTPFYVLLSVFCGCVIASNYWRPRRSARRARRGITGAATRGDANA
jgi:hypothetical protein